MSLRVSPPSSRRRPNLLRALGLATAAALALAAAPAASAQPFDDFLLFSGVGHKYVEVPASPGLNPTGGFTFEAWVKVTDSGGCTSIAGKGYTTAWWVGICGTTLRSYLRGSGSYLDGGVLPNRWTHVAVTWNGSRHRHYVDGELVADVADALPPTTNAQPVRFGSDVDWPYTPAGGTVDDAALWNVARTQSQIRADMYGIAPPQPGLVALWHFDSTLLDAAGSHDGIAHGAVFGYYGTGPSCAPAANSTRLCLLDRFLVSAVYRTGAPGTAEGTAHVVPVANDGSGIFWFFAANNWEVMLKAIDGCGLNDRFWFFSAATTNVFYRLEVFDYPSGTYRIYFNYPGPPAPAVTDTSAFATCP